MPAVVAAARGVAAVVVGSGQEARAGSADLAFGGGFNRFPMSNIQLAMNPAVQEDLKVTDKQKEQLNALNEQVEQKRQEFMPQGFGRGRGQTKGQGGGGPGGDQGQGGGPGPGGGPGGGGPQLDPEARKAAFAEMQEKMTNLRVQTDAALIKILTKPQRSRLTQIALRREGLLSAITRPDIQQKLNMSEEQIAEVATTLDQANQDRRQQQRESGKATQELFASLRPQAQGENEDGAAGGGGQGGGGGQPGTGKGGGRRGNFNREEFQALMEKPEVKAQFAKMAEQSKAFEDQTMARVGKILSKKQKGTWNAMIGKDFDVEQLNRRPGDPAAAKAKSESTTKASTSTAKPPAATTTAPTKKKSQRRRLPGDPE